MGFLPPEHPEGLFRCMPLLPRRKPRSKKVARVEVDDKEAHTHKRNKSQCSAKAQGQIKPPQPESPASKEASGAVDDSTSAARDSGGHESAPTRRIGAALALRRGPRPWSMKNLPYELRAQVN